MTQRSLGLNLHSLSLPLRMHPLHQQTRGSPLGNLIFLIPQAPNMHLQNLLRILSLNLWLWTSLCQSLKLCLPSLNPCRQKRASTWKMPSFGLETPPWMIIPTTPA